MHILRTKKIIFFLLTCFSFACFCHAQDEKPPVYVRIFDEVKKDIKSISEATKSKINSILMGNLFGNGTMTTSTSTLKTSSTTTSTTTLKTTSVSTPTTVETTSEKTLKTTSQTTPTKASTTTSETTSIATKTMKDSDVPFIITRRIITIGCKEGSVSSEGGCYQAV